MRSAASTFPIGIGSRNWLNTSCWTLGAENSRPGERYCRAHWPESATITTWCGAGALPARIVLFVVALILAGFDAGDPIAIGAIPIDGGLQAFFKRDLRLPSRFAHQFFAGKSIAAVMTGAILHRDHQTFRFVEHREHHLHNFEVG